MRVLKKLIGKIVFAVRIHFSTLVSTAGSGFVGAVFGAYAAGPSRSIGAIAGAVIAIIVVSIIMACVSVASGVSDDELRLRQQAAAFYRHLKKYEDGLPSDEEELADLRRATRALRIRVSDDLEESERKLRAAKRRTSQLTHHLEEIIKFEERLKDRG